MTSLKQDSLWTVRVIRGGMILFSFLFLVIKVIVPDGYSVTHSTVSGPACRCSVMQD